MFYINKIRTELHLTFGKLRIHGWKQKISMIIISIEILVCLVAWIGSIFKYSQVDSYISQLENDLGIESDVLSKIVHSITIIGLITGFLPIIYFG